MGVKANQRTKYVHPIATQRIMIKVLSMLDYQNPDKLSDELRLIIANSSSVTEAAVSIARRIERS